MLQSFTHWQTSLGVALFLIGQMLAIAHASEFGHDHHEHNGVACVVFISDEQDGLHPPASLDSPIFTAASSQVYELAAQTSRSQSRSIRPPPTGPPSP